MKILRSTIVYLLRNVNLLQQKHLLGDSGTMRLQGNKIYSAGIIGGVPVNRIIARLIILIR